MFEKETGDGWEPMATEDESGQEQVAVECGKLRSILVVKYSALTKSSTLTASFFKNLFCLTTLTASFFFNFILPHHFNC